MHSPPATVVSALSTALRADPTRPLVTMYDDATGERVELSVATFDNWVCKLANLFSDEWDLQSGELISVTMPAHWQTMVVLLGAWTAGLTVTLAPSPAAAASLTHWQDFAAEVPGQPDKLMLAATVSTNDIALADDSSTATHADLVGRGIAAAESIGLSAGGRLLTDVNPADQSGLDVAMLAPLVTGSSVVLLLNSTAERRTRVAAQERVTATRFASAAV